ncbi:hypothetical protein [Streptomyces sp. cg36]|uniref:hypothetical protein n=1 Tax=Streptomyces sp. cg36 TaxID=3238798 RepID=UPI0034E1D915
MADLNSARARETLTRIAKDYRRRWLPSEEDERAWYRNQPSLEHAIRYSGRCENAFGTQESHQRGTKSLYAKVTDAYLQPNKEALAEQEGFDDLITLVDRLVRHVPGIGEMYVYDVADHLAAYLGMSPAFVYLHRGTRDGTKALGIQCSPSDRYLPKRAFPQGLQSLEPWQIEDVLCIYKDILGRIACGQAVTPVNIQGCGRRGRKTASAC